MSRCRLNNCPVNRGQITQSVAVHYILSGTNTDKFIISMSGLALSLASLPKEAAQTPEANELIHFLNEMVLIHPVQTENMMRSLANDVGNFMMVAMAMSRMLNKDAAVIFIKILQTINAEKLKEMGLQQAETEQGAVKPFQIENVPAVDDKNFEQEVLKSKQPVLVVLGAGWCDACEQSAPVVQEISREYQGRLKVVTLDADANQKSYQQWKAGGVPTFILFQKGEEVARTMGFNASLKEQLENILESALPKVIKL